ncbi:Repeat domain-containing protein [Micromonospora haikouensis]|uniref:Repeat domain-containing protein n=1 Tax=Micromonospora haikouensis TaxID=686309 RepID=A0A1C4Y6I8_9ACTN|nr:CRTAC1 family protein [Micromonospora haikouensis]SCF16339.1 Repeat domain-containing protein [Micromonospora haikouensis]
MLGQRARSFSPGIVAILLAASLFFIIDSRVSVAGADEAATRYRFTEQPIAYPDGYDQLPKKTIRDVNPTYHKIRAWISSVGASIALNDLTDHGRANSMCFVDTRTNHVVVTYAPTAPKEDQFAPFILDPAPLPIDDTMAPMACVPGDYNLDGRMDLMVTYWGRVPILFLRKAGATTVSNATYQRQEMLPQSSPDGRYHGPKWHTNASLVSDLDGDGKPDVVIGNYFPESDVLNTRGQDNVEMNDTLSSATNGGGLHVLRWHSATTGDNPSVSFVAERGAVPFKKSTGWTLGLASADLTGRGLPDVYVANDFGHNHLLHNVSSPGHIKFKAAIGERTPTTPKSFVLGNGSFKGMGIDFGDLDRNGSFDMMVSNITTAWGLEESNFVWINRARDERDMLAKLGKGVAPFTQEARPLGMAWSGWGWDVKFGDFLNSGDLEVVQTLGFVKGKINRWPWLQEMAMMNDDLLSNPAMWPNLQPGDDIAGDQPLAFFARTASGEFANITKEIGLDVPIPTRGIATADTRGTGALDLAVARQWGAPAFYTNDAPSKGNFLNLRLYRPAVGAPAGQMLCTPAYGATVTVTTPDGRKQISQLDGGSGHAGKRSFEVHFGLGDSSGPVTVDLRWRDLNGQQHATSQQLTAGTHTLVLSDRVEEVPNR